MGFEIVLGHDKLTDLIKAAKGQEIDYNIRYLEVQTASDLGIFIEDWYRKSRLAREQIIAARLADNWITRFNVRKAHDRARK